MNQIYLSYHYPIPLKSSIRKKLEEATAHICLHFQKQRKIEGEGFEGIVKRTNKTTSLNGISGTIYSATIEHIDWELPNIIQLVVNERVMMNAVDDDLCLAMDLSANKAKIKLINNPLKKFDGKQN